MKFPNAAGSRGRNKQRLSAVVGIGLTSFLLPLAAAHAQSQLLGSTVGSTFYSTFTFGNAALQGDNFGNAAVQGNLTASSNSGFGETAAGISYANTTTLYVSGNATFGGGNMTGSYNVAGTVNGTINQSNPAPGGNKVGASATLPNFSSADTYATSLNSTTSGKSNTTGATVVYSGPSNATLNFNLPTNSSLATYYFNVTDAQLNSITSGMTLNLNGWTAGSSGVAAPTIVVNITGSNAATTPDFYFPTNGGYTNFNAAYTVWNVSSSIAGFGVNGTVAGSILAPGSLLTIGSNPAVSGTTISNGISDSGTKDNFGSNGTFLGTFGSSGTAPEPSTVALIAGGGSLVAFRRRRKNVAL